MRVTFVALALMIISLCVCRSTSNAGPPPTPDDGYAAPGLPIYAILAAYDQNRHVYTAEEIDALIKKPESVLDLLKNMKIAWDRKLLVQQQFWPTVVLLRFLNAERAEWRPIDPFGRQPPIYSPKRQLTRDTGTLIVHSNVLPTPVSVFRSRLTSPAEVASWVYAYPAHTESNGEIQFNVVPGSIKWEVVRNLFGTHFVNQGPPPWPVADGSSGQSAAGARLYGVRATPYLPPDIASEDFSVCYGSREGVPPALFTLSVASSDGVQDQICFGLDVGSKPLQDPHSPGPVRFRDPVDDDVLVYVKMSQHFGHIPLGCYPIKLDPSLKQWCPARGSQH